MIITKKRLRGTAKRETTDRHRPAVSRGKKQRPMRSSDQSALEITWRRASSSLRSFSSSATLARSSIARKRFDGVSIVVTVGGAVGDAAGPVVDSGVLVVSGFWGVPMLVSP